MSDYKYVLLADDGTSHDLARRKPFTGNTFDLPELLEAGWRPVHETPMSPGAFTNADGETENYSLVLILLVRD